MHTGRILTIAAATGPATQELIFVRIDETMHQAEPIWKRQLDDIRALLPPREDEELIDALLADFDEAVTDFAELTEAAAAGDEDARERMDSENEDPFTDLNRRAREYGLVACGEDG